ncbi:phospho-sugar mutase [Subtercola boreus]|uniref:Phosphomannomutase n=1 Tax=Subtercola boreus TaxID=120213 RepID=A0A3E0WCT6_9MICO|nr:phospho-sugar mutase [Subtercola boreus]RFA22605.1 phosphomannomutase [Subtercola boreus]RFA22961.1 phosphomannomutase [Subtercola boreus]RFA28712.1 phosphomannomutase [Subtercola boreus]
MSARGELSTAAHDWIAQDPDEETRAELTALVAAAEGDDEQAVSELADRFDGRLTFGTAGLRGAIAAGPNRMNRVLVAQAARGLAEYLLERAAPGETPSVVIGYDGRKNSDVFARDSAELFAGAGLRAVLLPRMLPTPLVAFAVRHLDATAGVMVTASHNPPNDNGYKVYLGGADRGSQIVSPVDEEIEAHILRVAARGSVAELTRSEGYELAPESVFEAYVAETAAVCWLPAAEIGAQPRTVYTAMHGVGWETLARVLGRAGFIEPDVVASQIMPDARFPTVSFPNPEEPGALDLAFAEARSGGAQLVIANDPDADRLAIAVPDSGSASGFRRLSGNEVGALLGWRVAEAHAARMRDGERDTRRAGPATAGSRAVPSAAPPATLATSCVSSPALAAVAAAYGLRFQETLTGFKWVSRVPGLIFGYEEALGYLVNPDTVRDKDGISAAVALLTLASDLAVDGYTLLDQLDRFSERFGHFGSVQIALRVTDLSLIDTVMKRLRSTPPTNIGGVQVAGIDDLAGGSAELPPSDILRIRMADGSRIMVRPSGTEPKLKVYLDASSSAGKLDKRKKTVAARLAALEAGMRELVS